MIKQYNVKELVEFLKVKEQTIRKYLREGKLKGVKVGKGYIVSETQLKEFLNRN